VPAFSGIAFLLRIGGAVLSGHFMAYPMYFQIAQTLTHGGGYYVAPGRMCAYFPPVYPTILAGCLLTGHFHAAVVAVSSALAAGLVFLTWRIGARLFGREVGLGAAAYCAVYPYYIWHDAVVQEDVTLAFLVALGVWCLVNAEVSARWALSSGIVLGLCVLTKANLLLFALAAPIWMGMEKRSFRRAGVALLGFLLTIGPWLIRTERLTGAPLIYSQAGRALWESNNAVTFRSFPQQSIDTVPGRATAEFSDQDRRELREVMAADPQGVGTSRWYWARGMRFIEEHPVLTLARGFRKIAIGFSPVFSPRKNFGPEAVYFVSYAPLLVGGVAGLWLSRRRWRRLGYLYCLFAMFAAGTAVFWAHTSHRVYLDPYLMMFSVFAIRRIMKSRARLYGADATSELVAGRTGCRDK
jgi:4-amino-4-deoxy-L-arabinose transferase-like glycosyltransferase